MQKRGFTLAEMLIVLAIVGIVVTIIMPVIRDLIPDEAEARGKKAYNTLSNVVESLVNDYDIYQDGILGKKANGETSPETYFCQQFSEKVNTSGSISCDSGKVSTQHLTISTQNDTSAKSLDNLCDKRNKNFSFKTTDGIYWYGMYDTFGTQDIDSNNIDRRYVVVCADPDPKNDSVLPYAFGVRQDGKITTGYRIQEILEKD